MQQYYSTGGLTMSSPSSEGGSGSGSGDSAPHYSNVPPVDPHFGNQGEYSNVNVSPKSQLQVGVGRGPSQSSNESRTTRASTASGSGSGTGTATGNGNGTVQRVRRVGAKERETLSTRLLSGHGQPQGVHASVGAVKSDTGGSGSGVVVPGGADPAVDREAYLIVHLDGGRVTAGEEGGREERLGEEIPPTYDSLPVGERL